MKLRMLRIFDGAIAHCLLKLLKADIALIGLGTGATAPVRRRPNKTAILDIFNCTNPHNHAG